MNTVSPKMVQRTSPNQALQRTPGFGVQLPGAALIRPAQSRAVLPAYHRMKPDKILGLMTTLFVTACASFVGHPLASNEFPVLDRSRLTSKQVDGLNRPEVDFRRVRAGEEPMYARLQHPLLEDGGTRIYDGDGYRLVAHHVIVYSVFRPDRIIGHTVGPEIIIEQTIAGRKLITFKDTRFVPLSKWKLSEPGSIVPQERLSPDSSFALRFHRHNKSFCYDLVERPSGAIVATASSGIMQNDFPKAAFAAHKTLLSPQTDPASSSPSAFPMAVQCSLTF